MVLIHPELLLVETKRGEEGRKAGGREGRRYCWEGSQAACLNISITRSEVREALLVYVHHNGKQPAMYTFNVYLEKTANDTVLLDSPPQAAITSWLSVQK